MINRYDKKTSRFLLLVGVAVLAVLIGPAAVRAQELPIPTYANSVIISIEHSPSDWAEVEYIKAHFPFGLYAWPSFSVTHIDPVLAWNSDWSQADAGIAAFKTTVDGYISSAKARGVKFHLVVCAGMARGIEIYADAKTEDVRNAQWFNDNNLGTADQVASSEAMTKYIFGTFSRYARKLRANLEAKAQAAFAFLKQRMDENPETFIAVSGWGESEMSNRREANHDGPQEWFCDYSPFAVLEFRDWITHEGLYDDVTGKYKGQGWAEGGATYRDINYFNTKFLTSFTTWDLRYYNWSLTDDWDSDPDDGVNADPGRIPRASYVQNGMKLTEGAGFIAGGFDPPRAQTPGDKFYDLWNLFRETMVHHFILDAAGWAADAGIPPDRWYSHQIPGDYLFGKQPSDAPWLGSRYYTSASPLWTAGISPMGSAGATIYDAKYPATEDTPEWIPRTTKYVFPAISALSENWAIMEYDPETYPLGYTVSQSPSADILAQYLRAYSYRPHLINFWRWWEDTEEHRIKGMNKEIALRDFIRQIRDKARSTDLTIVYSPPQVIGLTGAYGVFSSSAAVSAPTGLHSVARLEVTGKIWTGEAWTWMDWTNFDHFEVFRGETVDFAADSAHSIGTTMTYVYEDGSAAYGGTHYYKWRAVNSNGIKGPASDAVMVNASVPSVPALFLSRESLVFGLSEGGAPTPAQAVLVKNIGAAGTTLNWTAVSNQPWLLVAPASGTGNGILQISVNGSGLGTGTYSGQISVDDPQAANAPQAIDVRFDIYAQNSDAEPFGNFATPIDQSNVSSSIPVTGWALDDIGLLSVKLYRGTGLSDRIYIGDATFVQGARPDVEAAYPAYPQNDRAGWGYMLLTNFLPNGGNGTFQILAYATDTTGHEVLLGKKTIFCDNLNAVNPFGAIDTPTQGGTVSGGSSINFGWALTPQPNYIPLDGSTIWIWMDSVPVGHPVYNNYREDIATLFPAFANALGAVGYYYFDTTALENGTHTIVWGVTDSAGNADGIGSRYFEVLNIGADAAPAAVSDIPAAALLPETAGGRLSIETKSPLEIEIEELGQVRLEFTAAPGVRIIGWGPGDTKPLPIGSTLDKNGLFRWMPGPGFLGRHVLHFASTDGLSRGPAIEIGVTIVPKRNRKIGLTEK